MTTQKERDVYEESTVLIIKKAAGKNVFAADYLWELAVFTRIWDDIYDQDQEVTREQLLHIIEWLFIKLPSNPFFQTHRDMLYSQHLSMYNAWMASNEWEKGDETDRIYYHVWRDHIHEVVPIVALITQGPAMMEEVSRQIRVLFKKKLGE